MIHFMRSLYSTGIVYPWLLCIHEQLVVLNAAYWPPNTGSLFVEGSDVDYMLCDTVYFIGELVFILFAVF